jgi:hypothetical protein
MAEPTHPKPTKPDLKRVLALLRRARRAEKVRARQGETAARETALARAVPSTG